MSSAKVVQINLFMANNLPSRLSKAAKEQKVDLGKGVVAVKTVISSPPSYEFIPVGTKPAEIQAFVQKLAKQDGVELSAAVQKALGSE